ncbi:CBS domain-containing protein [Pseudonocardia humida]|uniref:CBS domain-containing protein n=1 Tax=Pseudonocardia humida TaxID=2800819 RepID=A0ABT1A1N6_9PSEU|nr:CBS domain-containing protein [Pseudonocardia humida]MCO1656920.1 CBS domain-containing protein [Pseudonocardia humida]
MRIADVLRNKGSDVATIPPEATVGSLIAELATHNVGALPVVEDGTLVGIVSERDVVRRLHTGGADLLSGPVRDIMSTSVTTCSPGDAVVDLARIMTTGRFRHLPVLQDGELIGIVSIGDLVKARIDQLESEREQLQSYIST